jgi:hypothetical protein
MSLPYNNRTETDLRAALINSPPVADAGGSYDMECDGQPTAVQLDGAGSWDPDRDPLTYAWTTSCPGGSFDNPAVADPVLLLNGPPPCPVGCDVTLTVTDSSGASDSDSAALTVNDTSPPVLTCSIEPAMDDENPDVHVDNLYIIRYAATDNCDAAPTVSGYLDVYGNDETCDDETSDFVGYPVKDGDYVKLSCDKRKGDCTAYLYDDENTDEGPEIAVEITGPAFKLAVKGADACGNRAEMECIQRCPEPTGCINSITLVSRQGDEQTFYWYEFQGHEPVFEVGGQRGEFSISCSKCLHVGDVSGDLTIACINAGEKLARRCRVPTD